jgi:hypothetical protein
VCEAPPDEAAFEEDFDDTGSPAEEGVPVEVTRAIAECCGMGRVLQS